jgi:hypothetical protein
VESWKKLKLQREKDFEQKYVRNQTGVDWEDRHGHSPYSAHSKCVSFLLARKPKDFARAEMEKSRAEKL